jgi:chromosome segregation ATPase
MFERASRNAQAAEERADRLASQLRTTEGRLGDAEEQLRSGRDFTDTLAMSLERSVAEREAIQADLPVLRRELDAMKATLATREATIDGKERELRDALEHLVTLRSGMTERTAERDALAQELAKAREVSAQLREDLQQRDEALARAQAEAEAAQIRLRRALDESAEYKESLNAEQTRIAGLAEQLTSYRTELEERAGAASWQPQTEGSSGPSEGPSTAPELDEVLQLTEEAVVRVMESARDRADRELRRLDEDRERIGREVEAMERWRDSAAPMIGMLRSTLAEVAGRADEIGLRVQEAVRPLTGAVTRLGSQLSSLDALWLNAPASVGRGDERSEGARVIELRDEQKDRARRDQ